MSYPSRPPLGIPMPGMAYMSMAGPPPLMPAVMPVQHFQQMIPMQVTTAPQIRAFPKLNPNRDQLKQIQGPPVTVFVGNITERASDTMIRLLLGTCGYVISWKRVKGFGFCELAGPDAGLRAVRLLHDMMVADKRLVAKVDAKTKTILDEYKAERRRKERKARGSSPLQDEPQDEDQLDEETLALDAVAVERMKQILTEHQDEMNNFEIKKEEEAMEKRNKVLDEAEVEEDKKDIIAREIGKFREIMKKQEEEKVSRRKGKEKQEQRSVSRSPSPQPKEKEEKKKRHSRSQSHDERNKERDREREIDRERERERDRERDREREIRDRERDREHNRDRDRDRNDRDRERDDREKSKHSKESLKEREIEEESKEKKKSERRAREKEAAYQERLRAWEIRERRKSKEYEKEREKERLKEEERERDAKRLKEFLEDYDDERDDVKFYKGSQLQKRLTERVKEAEADGRDRQKEKEEIEELKAKIFSSGLDDPSAEFEKAKKEREEQYKPKLLIDVNLDHRRQREKEREREIERQRARERERDRETERQLTRQRIKEERERFVVEQAAQELAAVQAEPIDSDSDVDGHHSPPLPDSITNTENHRESAKWTQIQAPDEDSRHSVISNNEETAPPPAGSGIKLTLAKPAGLHSPISNDNKRKKADLREVFNPDEDDTSTLVKKRKLVPLDYNDDKKNKKDKENNERKSEELAIKTQEEKRKHIKSLIEKIPTEKNALFSYHLDWSIIDNTLMEKKIRPWINKKIIEYIGEPEPTLVDFICSKVLAGSQPQVILEDVQMVLDEEAEVFVVKMWRLLIYEVEAKKLGLVK